VLLILDDEGLLLKAHYQRERRQLAQARRAAFADTPTGPNQVWQLDFSEYETPAGGTWRVAGVADYWSKVEFGWHWSPTANQHDAIAAVEIALAEAQRLLGGTPLVEHLADPIPARSCRSPSLPTKAARSGRSGSARSSPAAPSCATSAPA
jgi:putative transposase